MRHPIKLIIKKGKVHNDGTSQVFLQYCYSRTRRMLLGTSVNIPDLYWNKKTFSILESLPGKYGDPRKLESDLKEKLRRAENIVDYAIRNTHQCPMKFLKKHFATAKDYSLQEVISDLQKIDVFYQIESYLKDKQDLVKEATLVAIRSMKRHLQSFQDINRTSITFECFTAKFYEDLIRFLIYEMPIQRRRVVTKGLAINTIGKTIKQLKTFLKDRIRRKIIPLMDVSIIKGMQEDVDAVYLNWKELSKIYHLDLSSTPFLTKYRDLFIVACLTGFRFSDYSNIELHELKDGMLHIVQKKTLSPVIVPLREEARSILVDHYGMKIPKVSNQNFNFYIKEIVRLAGIKEPFKVTHKKGNTVREEIRPKYAWVSSHTARRSFCTNEFLAGTPTELIMAVSGHKSEKAFRKYIKADNTKKAELIKQLWDKRPGL